MPITGLRDRCEDCADHIGFDLCAFCMARGPGPVTGRFAQMHEASHRMRVVMPALHEMHVWQALHPELPLEQLLQLLDFHTEMQAVAPGPGAAQGRPGMGEGRVLDEASHGRRDQDAEPWLQDLARAVDEGGRPGGTGSSDDAPHDGSLSGDGAEVQALEAMLDDPSAMLNALTSDLEDIDGSGAAEAVLRLGPDASSRGASAGMEGAPSAAPTLSGPAEAQVVNEHQGHAWLRPRHPVLAAGQHHRGRSGGLASHPLSPGSSASDDQEAAEGASVDTGEVAGTGGADIGS